MVVIGNKKNKKVCNRLPNKKKWRQWNVRKKLMIIHFWKIMEAINVVLLKNLVFNLNKCMIEKITK